MPEPGWSRKPLVFLDVDGVINDLRMLNALHGAIPPDDYVQLESRGYCIYIPKWMTERFRELHEVAEIVWLTTWRCEANRDIGPALGLPRLDCIDDGSDERIVSWKWITARDRARAAINGYRKVFWIEDFGNDPQAIEARANGVQTCNTAETGYVLSEKDFDRILETCKWATSQQTGPQSSGSD